MANAPPGKGLGTVKIDDTKTKKFLADGESFESDIEVPRSPDLVKGVEFLVPLLGTDHFKWTSEKDGIFQLIALDKASELLKDKKTSLQDALRDACKTGDLVQQGNGDDTYALSPNAREFLQKLSRN